MADDWAMRESSSAQSLEIMRQTRRIERMRAALEQIRRIAVAEYSVGNQFWWAEANRIAQKALKDG